MRGFGALTAAVLAFAVAAAAPAAGQAAAAEDDGPTAYLDGRRISLADISRYYCDDFSYPVIKCSRSPVLVEARATTVALLAGVDYVTIYDLPGYSGTWMHVSQNYTALGLIGWNDRVSSFRGRNGQAGRFYTDWWYGGSYWGFCCNQTTTPLGSWDNTFSSVMRT